MIKKGATKMEIQDYYKICKELHKIYLNRPKHKHINPTRTSSGLVFGVRKKVIL